MKAWRYTMSEAKSIAYIIQSMKDQMMPVEC